MGTAARTAPPHDVAAEQAILGAAMLSERALEVLATELRPDDFYVPGHKALAGALTRAFEARSPADAVTIADDLRRRDELEILGGPGELLRLLNDTPSSSNAAAYAEIVHDHATTRRLLKAGLDLVDLTRTTPGDVHELVLRAQDLVGGVASQNGARTYSSIVRADVAGLVAGEIELEQAQLLTREDGRSLLYAGKIHLLLAPPSVGKTWVSLLAILEALRLGGSAVMIDYEDTAAGVVGRLKALGADPDDVADRFTYVGIDGPVGTAELLELGRILEDLNPDLVVIDGVAVALARDGFDENSNGDVARWFEKVPRWIARTSGAAVLMLDHVVKDTEKRASQPRGAGHKLAAVDGAAYELVVGTRFSRSTPGRFALKIAKDRPGGVGEIGQTAAVAVVEPHGDGARVVMRLEAPGELSSGIAGRPTIVMGMISETLTNAKVPVSAKTLRDLVHAKPRVVDAALAHLRADGYVIDQRVGRSICLKLVKPYDGTPPPGAPPQLRLVVENPDDPDDDDRARP